MEHVFDNLIEANPDSDNFGKPIKIVCDDQADLKVFDDAGRRGREFGRRVRIIAEQIEMTK